MKYYLSFLFSFCFISIIAQNNPNIEQFINTPGLEHASIGISVKDLSGKDIAFFNKKASLTPASTLKIFTTATSLEILGEDFNFKTELSVNKNDKQNLIIEGYGDPTLGSEYLFQDKTQFLETWVRTIKENIDTEQDIKLTIIDNYFGYNAISSKWLREDLGNYYASGTYAISVFDNTYRLYLNTNSENEAPIIDKSAPNMSDISFTNHLIVSKKNDGYILGEPLSFNRTLIGTLPPKRKSLILKGDFPDPSLVLATSLSDRLKAIDIHIGEIETTRDNYLSKLNSSDKEDSFEKDLFYTHLSPNLRKIIRVVNERSNNHYSEHLIRTIGRKANSDIYSDPLIEGINSAKEYWESEGISTKGFRVYDGCGLAPSNAIDTESLTDILVYMQTKSKHKDAFFASLPKAGLEGTVKNLLKDSRLQGKIFVKSGSIANVQCFAGYYIDGDKKYAFSIMVNNFNSPRKDIVKAIENLLLGLF